MPNALIEAVVKSLSTSASSSDSTLTLLNTAEPMARLGACKAGFSPPVIVILYYRSNAILLLWFELFNVLVLNCAVCFFCAFSYFLYIYLNSGK